MITPGWYWILVMALPMSSMYIQAHRLQTLESSQAIKLRRKTAMDSQTIGGTIVSTAHRVRLSTSKSTITDTGEKFHSPCADTFDRECERSRNYGLAYSDQRTSL